MLVLLNFIVKEVHLWLKDLAVRARAEARLWARVRVTDTAAKPGADATHTQTRPRT